MKEKNNLQLILLLTLLLLSIIFFWLFKYQEGNLNSENIKNNNIQKEKISVFEKQEIKRIKAFDLLASRTEENINKAVDEFKGIYYSKDSRAYQKAVVLQKIATLYWRTGGNEKVTDYIYKDDFAEYKDKTILLSNVKLLKKSFELWPLPRTAIEISFAYIADGDEKSGKEWLKKYEEMKGDGNVKTFTLYREFLVYRVLSKNEKGHDDKIVELYKKTKNSLESGSKTITEGKHDYYKQSIPFLDVFYGSYLADKDKKENAEEIDSVVNEIMDLVNDDKNKDQNEFIYFLNIQKDKEECDYICRTFIKSLAKASEKFRTFVLSYGLSENCSK